MDDVSEQALQNPGEEGSREGEEEQEEGGGEGEMEEGGRRR